MTSSGCVIFLITIEVLLLVTTVKANGCFANREIFEEYTQYIQPLSLENRLHYQPATYEDPKKMTTESEPNFPKHVKKTYTCLEEYEGNRMLVEVEDMKKNKIQYQCLKFASLTKYIVRQAKTPLRSSREKVNCVKDKYSTDEALIIAMDMLKPEPCPLKGGYQMIFHEGEVIKGHCLDSVLTYNPNMRFECDGHNVIADFGRDCEPPKLRLLQKMRRRHIAHLSCVGNWSENGDVKSVLLQMRDMPYDMWCIHYKRMNDSNDLLSVFMTLDGRCVENAFHDESFPRETSMFGQLASYVPSNDPRCSNSVHLDECKENEAKCFESTQCPDNCKRCNSKVTTCPNDFSKDLQGNWKTLDTNQGMMVDIAGNSFEVSRYGRFSCRGEVEFPSHLYPVVQSDAMTSCMPYYACAHLSNPAPGVLNFKLFPAWRDEDDGHPFTCQQTVDKIGYVTPVKDERMTTMLVTEKLERSSCGFEMATPFPTLVEECMVWVEACGSGCSQLNVHYDNDTCGEHPNLGFEIENDHVCYAKLDFVEDGVHGILTYSEFSDRYLCWIYNFDLLYIAPPSACNSEGVKRIFAEEGAGITYDPATWLMKPVHGEAKKNPGNGVQLIPNYMLDLFSVCLLSLLSYLRYT